MEFYTNTGFKKPQNQNTNYGTKYASSQKFSKDSQYSSGNPEIPA